MAFQDGVPGQIGTVLSGVLLLTAARVLEPAQVLWVGLAVALVTIAVAIGIRRRYASSLLATLRRGVGEQVLEGGPGLGSLVDAPDVRAVLVDGPPRPGPAGPRDGGVDARPGAGRRHLDALLAALDDPEPGVRAAAATALASHDADPSRACRPRDRHDRRPPVDRRARAGRRSRGPRPPRAAAHGRPASGLPRRPDPAVRAAAVGDAGGRPARRSRPGHGPPGPGVPRPARRRRRPGRGAVGPRAGGRAAGCRRSRCRRRQRWAPWPATRPEVRDVLVAWVGRRGSTGRCTSPAPRPRSRAAPHRARIAAFLADVLARRRDQQQDLALDALAVLEMAEARGVIRRCLRSSDADVRAQAIETLDSLGDRRLGRCASPASSRWTSRPPTGRRSTTRWTACGMMTIRGSGAWRTGSRAKEGRCQARTASLGEIDRMLELRRVPLFERLDPEDLQRVAAVGRRAAFAPDAAHRARGRGRRRAVRDPRGHGPRERVEPDGSTPLPRPTARATTSASSRCSCERPRVATVVAEADGSGPWSSAARA